MKKGILYYLAAWIIAAVSFTAVFFIVGSKSPFGYYWTGYLAAMLFLLIHLVTGLMVMSRKSARQMVYHAPMMKYSYSGLVLSLSASLYFITKPYLPSWLGIIAQVIIAAITIILALGSKAGADIITAQDRKTTEQTSFMLLMTNRAELLMKQESDPELKREYKKIYEALKFSDPMSVPEVRNTEKKIEELFYTLESIQDKSEREELIKKLTDAIKERNSTVSYMKRR